MLKTQHDDGNDFAYRENGMLAIQPNRANDLQTMNELWLELLPAPYLSFLPIE